MTQAPPPYGGQPPPYPAPRPQKPRPSGWWFALGGALLVAAVVAFVAGIAWLVLGTGFLDTDATIPADGRPYEVTVGTDGDRVIWRSGEPFQLTPCVVTDLETGEDIPLDPFTGDFSRDDWHASVRFDPGSGHLQVQCRSAAGADQDVLIGPAPSFAQIAGGLVLAIAVAGFLGLLGVVALVVTGVLWASRPPRTKP